jgi:hypothetical protein
LTNAGLALVLTGHCHKTEDSDTDSQRRFARGRGPHGDQISGNDERE